MTGKTWHFVIEGRPVSSTNSQQIIRHKATGRRLVLKSKAQREWRAMALAQLTAQRGPMRPIAAPVSLTLYVWRQTRAGDVDNYVKGVMDALQQARILDDDKQVCELHVYRMTDPSHPRIDVTVAIVADPDAPPP